MDRYQKIYDGLNEKLLKLQKELDTLQDEEKPINQDYEKTVDELSLKKRILEDLEKKALLVRPKELDEEFMNLRHEKLLNRVLWLFVSIYSLICLIILVISLLLVPSALMALAVIGLNCIGASIFGNKVVGKIVSKIISREIERAKNTTTCKEYLEICKEIDVLRNEMSLVVCEENNQLKLLSELSSKKMAIVDDMYELENMIGSLEELERMYVLESDNKLDNTDVKKKILKKQNINS